MALASTLIPLGIEVGGSLLAKATSDRPDVPDLVQPTVEQVKNQQRELRGHLSANADELEANLAARGVTGSGGSAQRQDIFESAASAGAELNARASDIISDAIRRQRMLEFRNQSNRARAQSQGISSLASSVAGGLRQDDLVSSLGDEKSIIDKITNLFGSESGGSNFTPTLTDSVQNEFGL